MRRSALALLLAALPIAAAAQDASGRTWTVESGKSLVVEVGPYLSYVVLDPERIEIEELTEGRLLVSALPGRGTAVMHIFTEEGPRTLVFRVIPPEPEPYVPPETSPSARPRVRPSTDLMFATHATLTGNGSSTLANSFHELSVRQAYGDTRFEGNLSLLGREGDGWYVPHIGLRFHRGALGIGLGDEPIVLVPSQATMAARGLSLTWSPDPERATAGLFVGGTRPLFCCGILDSEEPSLAVVQGGYGLHSRNWGYGAAGIMRDPDQDELRPLLRVGLERNTGGSEIATELFYIGEGGGARTDVRLSRDRFDLFSYAAYTSSGTYLGRYMQQSDRLEAQVAPMWRLGGRWVLHASGSFGYVDNSGGVDHLRGSAQLGAHYLKSRATTLQFNYRYFGSWMRPEESWNAGDGRHAGELISTHATARGHRFRNVVGVGFNDDGFYRAYAGHRSDLRMTKASRYGFAASGSIGSGGEWQSYLAGHMTRDIGRLYLRAQLGLIARERDSTGLATRPVASGEVGWYPVPGHRLGLDWNVTYDSETETTAWRVIAGYTLARRLVRRPDGRSLVISGSIRGFIYEDLDGDGGRDPDEPGIPDILVKLDGGRSAVTDAQGSFRLGDVVPGRHEVSVERDEWHTVDGTRRIVAVRPREAAAASFALSTGRRIVVRIFDDRDRDGTFSSGDISIPVPAVTLLDAQGSRIGVHPAPRGVADFGALRPGRYEVSVDPMGIPAGYGYGASLKQSAELERADYAVLDFPLRALRTIGGRVYLDSCPDGRITDCDEPAAGVTVTLSDGRQSVTDSEGRFLFRDLDEGIFEVRVDGAKDIPVVRMVGAPGNKLDLRILVE